MRVAIVGANGQLAYDLMPALGAAGHFAVGLSHEQIEVVDGESVGAALNASGPDLVVNTSAYHRVDEAEDNPDQAFRVNTAGVRNLALACRDLDVPLLHLSTDYVFSGTKASPYTESEAVDPINIYGVSKAAGEMVLRYVWPRHFIVRTSGLYGVAGSAGKGGNFVETMLRLARDGSPIKVVNDQRLTPTSTRALAMQIAELISTEAYGTYHATSQGHCTWYEFASEIFRRSDLQPELAPQSTAESGARARRPPYSVLENSQLKRLGLDRMPAWQNGLAEYLQLRQAK